jgi:ParB-like chromosome segregation protein Spo0J
MEIRNLPVAAIQPAAYNPRQPLRPGQTRYRKLRRSLEKFGLVEPLVWNEVTGRLVGGHQRLAILQELGATEVPVSVVRLPESQEKALNVLLNNREAQSDWDLSQLRVVLDELAAAPTGLLTETGFDPAHLHLLREQLAPVQPAAAAQPPALVELVLRLPVSQLAEVRRDLDPVINRFQLECHVHWRDQVPAQSGANSRRCRGRRRPDQAADPASSGKPLVPGSAQT